MKRIIRTILLFVLVFALAVPSIIIAADFVDVAEGKWYEEAVEYVTEKGYFSGTSQNTFEPKTEMTRAMFVTVLAALSGENLDGFKIIKFADVKEGSWYNAAVAWAFAKGIVSGTSETAFSPKASINRQEACVMLCKYIDCYGYTLTVDGSDFIASDDDKISSWAKESVYKINSYGIMTGKGEGVFDPKGTATRAEVAQMIMKLDMAISETKMLNVDEVEIIIEGLEKSTKIMHVSDSHLTLTDSSDTIDAVNYQKTREEMFMSEVTDGVTATQRFDRVIKYAETNEIDLIALSGDIVDAPTWGNINYFKNKMNSTEVDHLYAFGNHDWTASWLDATLGGYQSNAQWDKHTPMFNEVIGEGEEKIAVREYDGFTVIAVDNSNNQISAEQYAQIFPYLEGKTPIILMMHVPLYIESMESDVSAVWGKPILMGAPATNPTNTTQMFCNILKSKSSPVVAILAGHIHMDHVDDVSDNNDAVQYTLGASFKGDIRVLNIHG
ncbi:MAG: S-layer homology domain-containing protein [Clostridia bacterium]|nr:S-layer homology domain-containing protein [Clostridia bacterium]